MDWAGWALFGAVATTALTAVMIAAQMAGLTRLDLPLLWVGAPHEIGEHPVEHPMAYRPAHPDGAKEGEQHSHLPAH